MEFATSRILRFFTAVLRFYLKPFDQFLRRVEGFSATVTKPAPSQPRDDRIAKIDVARENLQDALSALGELKAEAEQNKVALEEAIRRLDETKAGREREAEGLRQIRAIAEADIAAFRKMAGINPGRERLAGFLGGVVASLIAAGLWKLGEWIF